MMMTTMMTIGSITSSNYVNELDKLFGLVSGLFGLDQPLLCSGLPMMMMMMLLLLMVMLLFVNAAGVRKSFHMVNAKKMWTNSETNASPPSSASQRKRTH